MYPKPAKRIAEFEQLAYGMFIHWGLYSFLGRGEWVRKLNGIPVEDYNRLSDIFTAEEFDADSIAALARQVGMKYICITTRHHDGYSLYDTRGLCDFDAAHTGPGRDLILEFVQGCRNNGIVPFFYHTTLDWYQDIFETDFDAYLQYLNDSVEVLCANYGKIGGIWFDGNWSKPNADWKVDNLYAIIRKHQPDAIIVNNTGLKSRGEFGHPEIDSVTFERGYPEPLDRAGMRKYVASEMCDTFNSNWGISSLDFNYISPADIIKKLCACRRASANFLLNIGPEASGKIPACETELLKKASKWIEIAGEPLYKGKCISLKATSRDFALEYQNKIYLFIHELPISGDLNVVLRSSGENLRSFRGITKEISYAKWVDNGQALDFSQNKDVGIFTLDATHQMYGTDLVVRIAELG
jgi:alpha-L-fucosidase